jgi:hypothetical protein
LETIERCFARAWASSILKTPHPRPLSPKNGARVEKPRMLVFLLRGEGKKIKMLVVAMNNP